MKNKFAVPLAEVPRQGSVTEEYFLRMMSPKALAIAEPFLLEETQALREVVAQLNDSMKYNIIAVGAGQLSHLKLALEKTNSYTSIDPLTDLYINSQIQYLTSRFNNIRLIKSILANIDKNDLFEGRNIIVFHFNIISYLTHPIDSINKLVNKGDILFFTSWNKSENSKELRTRYFNYLNSLEERTIIDPEKTIGLCNLRAFPFEELKHYKQHFLIEGNVIDILVIYL